MREDSYLVIDEKVLPEVYQKVVQANALLESGQAASTSEAVRMAGLSRSVYYKYRDAVFPYTRRDPSRILTVFYRAGANILTVNQNIPVKGRAFVSVSARLDPGTMPADQLLESLKQAEGVLKIDSIVE